MRLAKDLGLTLEKALDMSTLEFKMWAAYYSLENKEQKGRMQNGGRKHNR